MAGLDIEDRTVENQEHSCCEAKDTIVFEWCGDFEGVSFFDGVAEQGVEFLLLIGWMVVFVSSIIQ